MINHQMRSWLKTHTPLIANIASRAYSIARVGANKKITKSFQKPLFTGLYIDVMNGENVPKEELISKIDSGHIILAKDLLNNVGLEEEIKSLLSNSYRIPYEDLDRIHELLTLDQILEISEKLQLSENMLKIECSIFFALFGSSKELYAEMMPNLRPQIPHSFFSGKEKEIESRIGRGKMNPHGPHKDSWRYHPFNTINVWAALSAATPLNGMMVIPHTVDYSPKFANNEIIYGCDTYPEKQYITQMNSGDVLLFRGELVHGSILNQTDKTRFAFSMRCTLEKPSFHRNFMYNYVRILPTFSNLTINKIFSKNLFEPKSRDIHFETFGPQPRPLRKISREENGKLIVQTSEGEKKFCLRCPHKGAPLIDGWLENGKIVCPQHQLRIDPLE